MTSWRQMFEKYLPDGPAAQPPEQARAQVATLQETLNAFLEDTFVGQSEDGSVEVTLAGTGRVVLVRISSAAQAALPAIQLGQVILEAYRRAAADLNAQLAERTAAALPGVQDTADVQQRLDRANEAFDALRRWGGTR